MDDEKPDLTVIDGGLAAETEPVKIEHRGGDTTGGKLTGKQEAFVQNCLKGMDQTAAYRAAGYKVDGSTDKTVWENASRLFANPKVSARIKAGRKAQTVSAAHSGASLRASLIRRLEKMTTSADTDANRLRAMEILGKTEYVSLFLDRSTDVPAESLTPEEVEEQLTAKLKAAFNE